jgi:hypothetical protein
VRWARIFAAAGLICSSEAIPSTNFPSDALSLQLLRIVHNVFISYLEIDSARDRSTNPKQ